MNAQKRETDASLPCVKNSLLAGTVLLTSGTNSLQASDPLVSKFLDEVVDCLSDRMVCISCPNSIFIANLYQTAKIAGNCVRSLLLQAPKTSADQSIARYLLPRLVAFATNTEMEDPEKARSLVAHSLTSFTAALPNAQHGAGMSLIIPMLLSRASNEGSAGGVYQETSARLLELAGADQGAFRGVVAGMTDGQKTFMEEIIKSGRASGGPVKKVNNEEDAEPTIALRMNFGGS